MVINGTTENGNPLFQVPYFQHWNNYWNAAMQTLDENDIIIGGKQPPTPSSSITTFLPSWENPGYKISENQGLNYFLQYNHDTKTFILNGAKYLNRNELNTNSNMIEFNIQSIFDEVKYNSGRLVYDTIIPMKRDNVYDFQMITFGITKSGEDNLKFRVKNLWWRSSSVVVPFLIPLNFTFSRDSLMAYSQ